MFHLISSSVSTHLPWQGPPTHWTQPGAHTPTSHNILQAPGPCGAWDSLAREAWRPGCSVARRQSARHGTYTGTYSWGKRSGHSDRQNHLKYTHLRHELEEKDKIGKSSWSLFCSFWAGQAMTNNFRIHLCHIRSFSTYRRPCHTAMGHSPAQIPVLLWTPAVYSHCSPLRVSHGFISEHACPFWRAHTRQQAQSSRIRGTPGGHGGGSSGHWHLRGQTCEQASVNVWKRQWIIVLCCWKSLFFF